MVTLGRRMRDPTPLCYVCFFPVVARASSSRGGSRAAHNLHEKIREALQAERTSLLHFSPAKCQVPSGFNARSQAGKPRSCSQWLGRLRSRVGEGSFSAFLTSKSWPRSCHIRLAVLAGEAVAVGPSSGASLAAAPWEVVAEQLRRRIRPG